MSEYVCEVAFGVEVYGNGMLRGYERIEERREEIVRCRDCVHWRKPNDYERSKCTGAMAFVEPTCDGYCAWGERREESCK